MSTVLHPEPHLSIVSFDIPVPVNYGGAIDIFHKIKSLHKKGVHIHLHCFQYGRKPEQELEKYCASVHYYTRKLSLIHTFHRLPYIVRTRSSPQLLEALSREPYPILFEGLHSCYFLDHPDLRQHRKIVRTHNIEHDYYFHLGQVEAKWWKKNYFMREARKLKDFESTLEHAFGIAAISIKDQQYLSDRFPSKQVENISAFHPFNQVSVLPGISSFALYHGSLEVGENNQAALFLIRKLFQNTNIPLIIAGNKPSKELFQEASKFSHIEILTGLSSEAIYQLVKEAQVNILPTFQATGIKLKLLSALFSGRHCVVNTPMVEKTGLESLCHIEDQADSMLAALESLMGIPVSSTEITAREKVLLQGGFSNGHNAEKLIRLLFP